MSIESLAKSLEPWMRVGTWHTSHPLDEERFHRALSEAIREHGTKLGYEEFKAAMEHFLRERASSTSIEGYESAIGRYMPDSTKSTAAIISAL